MPSISPTSFSVPRGRTKQLVGSGIASGAFWTVYGPGSIDQTGVYAAPSSVSGTQTAAVYYHTEGWGYFPPAYFTKNADDTLTKITDAPGYYGQVSGAGVINGAGDYVEYVAHTNNPYWVGIRNATGTMEFVFSLNGLQIRETHPSGNTVSPFSFAIGAGEVIRFELMPGGYPRITVSGVEKYRSTRVYYTEPLYFECDAVAPAGTIFLPPRWYGPTYGNYSFATSAATVLPDILLPYEGCELYCEPQMMGLSDNAAVTTLTDYSSKDRHLTAAAPYPTFKTGIQGGKAIVRFDGASQQPLRNSANFPVRCGWVVAKYNAASFPDYKGLLTTFNNFGILVGNASDVEWFDWQWPWWEFRAGDRIYPQSAFPGPMQQFKILFFRFWDGPVAFDGVQLGRDRSSWGNTRLWNGDVALLALYSRDFTEDEIYACTRKLAANFGLTADMADVYPYQADVADTAETALVTVNTYDPPEGARISEVLGTPKRLLDLKFSAASPDEVRAMRDFHRSHYPDVPCIYRDCRLTPPEDITGYINSPYELEGSGSDFTYSFTFLEK